MDLKNAAAVCVISFFSATLVVLIARSLDSQAASRLEPQLASIVEELRALRGQGGVVSASGAPTKTQTVSNGLIVYYFHSNTRCPTCQSIESQAEETVRTHFASQLKNGEITWTIVNYEQPAAKSLATKFEIQMPVVVLARMKDGQVKNWKRLDEVWAVVGDKPAFAKYVGGEIERMLSPGKKAEAAPTQTPGLTIPIPNAASVPTKKTSTIPIPH
jgi:hypothetical protein